LCTIGLSNFFGLASLFYNFSLNKDKIQAKNVFNMFFGENGFLDRYCKDKKVIGLYEIVIKYKYQGK